MNSIWPLLVVDGVIGGNTNRAWQAFRYAAGIKLVGDPGASIPAATGAMQTNLWRASGLSSGTGFSTLSGVLTLPTSNRQALTTITEALESLAGTRA
jgi:hypothetical protein